MSDTEDTTDTLLSLDDGSVCLKTRDGLLLKFGNKGDSQLSMPFIASIGLKDILSLESYKIFRTEQTTAHHAVFMNGASLRLLYNKYGEIISLQTNGLHQAISEENEVLLHVEEP